MPELPADPPPPADPPSPPSTPAPPTATPAAPAARPRSRFRRWTRRLFKIGLVLFVLFVVAVLGLRTTYRVIGARELAAATAKLDAEEPGWRIADITAARDKARPPDDQNSALVVARVRKKIPNGWRFAYESRPNPDQEEKAPRNHKCHLDELLGGENELDEDRFRAWERVNGLPTEEPLTLDNLMESTAEARNLGLTLTAFPRGYRAIEFSDNPFDISLEAEQNTRTVAALMLDDALLAAHANDPARALQAVHAVLNTGRSIGDQPIIISHLVRVACGSIACNAATRTLALTDAKKPIVELGELQSALLTEADEPLLLIALRGERGQMHLAFENINNGKLVAHVLEHGGKMEERSRSDRLAHWLVDGFFHRDHAKYLELSSKAVAIAKLPHHEQQGGMKQLEADVRATVKVWWGLPYWRSRRLMPAVEKLAESILRYRAELLATATGIACERFRLARGRWPNSLDEIPKDILAAVPTDPYTGKPLTLTKVEGGIAVTSVGDGKRGRGDGDGRTGIGPLGGTDVGCRLYDPALRGLPPLPRKPKVDPFAPADPNDEDKE